MTRSTIALGLGLAVTILAAARPCAAVDPEEVYQAAVADLKAGNPAACAKFAEARRLKPDSSAALQGLAQCYDKFGKSASAWGKYRELIVELKASGDTARANAVARRADELLPLLASVTLVPASPDTPGLIIRLDGEDVPRAMFGSKLNADPGDHLIEATAPGHELWKTTITLGAAGEGRVVQVPALAAVTAPAPDGASFQWTRQRVAGVAMAGVGVLGIAAGAAFGGLAIGKNNASRADCAIVHVNVCDAAGVSLRGTATTFASASTGALIAGAALVVGGGVVFFTGRAGAQPQTGRIEIAPVAGVDGAGIRVRGEW